MPRPMAEPSRPAPDRDPWRREDAADALLGERLRRAGGREVRVLNVGCGDGAYLAGQIRAFGDVPAEWHGLDASAGLLARARTRCGRARLAHGRAESLPYPDGAFAYVVCRYAYHDFADKLAAFDELRRVLAPDGTLVLEDLAPDVSPHWWVYRYFPETVLLDEERYWPVERLRDEFARRRLRVEMAVERWEQVLPLAEAWQRASRRDHSQLRLLPDAAHARGMARLERALAADPGGAMRSAGTTICAVGARVGEA